MDSWVQVGQQRPVRHPFTHLRLVPRRAPVLPLLRELAMCAFFWTMVAWSVGATTDGAVLEQVRSPTWSFPRMCNH